MEKCFFFFLNHHDPHLELLILMMIRWASNDDYDISMIITFTLFFSFFLSQKKWNRIHFKSSRIIKKKEKEKKIAKSKSLLHFSKLKGFFHIFFPFLSSVFFQRVNNGAQNQEILVFFLCWNLMNQYDDDDDELALDITTVVITLVL